MSENVPIHEKVPDSESFAGDTCKSNEISLSVDGTIGVSDCVCVWCS